MKVIGFDPGETTGFAILDQDGELLDFGQLKSMEALIEHLDRLDPTQFKQVIIEAYRILPGKQMMHTGRPVVTEQIVGMIKAWAIRKKVGVTTYWSSDKPIQQKHSGVKPTGAHSKSHWVDAYNHAWWWLFKNKYVVSELQRKKGMVAQNGKKA